MEVASKITRADALKMLGLMQQADKVAIKVAFRNKAMETHPDRLPDDPTAVAKFTQVKQAYDMLMRDDGEEEKSDSKANFRGPDVYTDISATLEQIFSKRVIHIKAAPGSSCQTCNGTGKKKAQHPTKCVKCSGEGWIKVSKGLMRSKVKCQSCNGKGEIDTADCTTCAGSGVNPLSEGISVVLPDHMVDGETVTFNGMGVLPLGGGRRGDLYVTLKLEPHPRFKRQGADLLCVVDVSFTKLCLGGSFFIKGLDKTDLEIQISPLTANKTVISIPNAGMVDKNGNRGKIIVMLHAKLPTELSEEQIEILKKFQKTEHVSGS